MFHLPVLSSLFNPPAHHPSIRPPGKEQRRLCAPPWVNAGGEPMVNHIETSIESISESFWNITTTDFFFSNILAEREQNKGRWTALSCLPRNKPHIQCEKPVDRVKGAVLFLMTRTSYPSSVLETCWNIYTVYTYII